jgi:hypothetical protein
VEKVGEIPTAERILVQTHSISKAKTEEASVIFGNSFNKNIIADCFIQHRPKASPGIFD